MSEASTEKLEVLLAGLPWLLLRFKRALKSHARAAAIDARDWTEQGRGKTREGAASGGVAASADFGFFALLLEPILASLESAAKVSTSITMTWSGVLICNDYQRQSCSCAAMKLQGSQTEADREQHNGPNSQHTKKRAAPEQGKKAAKKRTLLDGEPERLRSGDSAWPVLADGAAMLVGILKSAGDDPTDAAITCMHTCLAHMRSESKSCSL